MTYTYSIYGITLHLPFPCPMLSPATSVIGHDVTVVYGKVPMNLDGPAASDDSWASGFAWQALPGRYLLKGGMRSCRFLVEGGERITVDRNASADDERLFFHLLHPVIAAVLKQRGLLVLHANAALTTAGVVALAGASGAGKSTTLAALLHRGCAMVSDDITVLCFNATGCVEAIPGVARLHLWEQAAERLGLDTSGLSRHPMRSRKVAVPAPGEMRATPAPLRALYLLNAYTGDKLLLFSLTGMDKFNALQDCVYGPLFPEEHPGLFSLFSTTATQADIFRIERPEGRWTVEEVADAIMSKTRYKAFDRGGVFDSKIQF